MGSEFNVEEAEAPSARSSFANLDDDEESQDDRDEDDEDEYMDVPNNRVSDFEWISKHEPLLLQSSSGFM